MPLWSGIWNDGLSDESVEDMANSNLQVMRFLGLSLEDDVPGHSVLLRLRTLPQWYEHGKLRLRKTIMLMQALRNPRKPKIKLAYEVVGDRKEHDDETNTQSAASS